MSRFGIDDILILWTTDNVGTAINMVLMYAENAKKQGWWDDVVLLLWGSSSKLASENAEIQNLIQTVLREKVRVIACKQCAENYNIVDDLQNQGIEVFYTGKFLSDWIRDNKKLITV